ncbi:hypothetical protein P879_04116 [Paragonimus westermani]|uniref:Actin-related protein 8 n=1 Tax=Paragonimus westermani TaxID=34504 RepID=A0A8T0D243_9TREM|nr:hypothetical protein P879_04116 [Paragonimus westermani]
MKTPCAAAERTVVIEPGSYYLKIGRAVDTQPKKFPHCIARRLKKHASDAASLLSGRKPKLQMSCTDKSLSSSISELFNLPASEELLVEESTLQLQPVDGCSPLTNSCDQFNLTTTNGHVPPVGEFAVCNEALLLCGNPDYQLFWPIQHGFLQQDANCSAVIQDLEDIWTTALEKHLEIPRVNLPSYRAILVIGDVFRRYEVRHLSELLLNKLCFGQMFVHQSAVCVTYCLGLLTACVVDVGEQKTSVCCVEDGVTTPDTRVVLSVGRSNVVRAFHDLVLPHGWRSEGGKPVDIDYSSMADLESLRMCLQTAEKAASDLLFPPYGGGRKGDGDKPIGSSMNLSVPLLWPRARKQIASLPINVLTVLYANILPFACVNFTAEPFCREKPGIFYECQSPSLDASQPDDPFDDLFVNLTARERRKRNPGQTNTTNDPAVLETTSEAKTADANESQAIESVQPQFVTNPPSASQNPCEAFDSLAAAIWWSVSQYANSVGCQTLLDPSIVPHYPAAPIGQVALEEARRRLLSSILLVGGGACGFAGQCLKKWLVAGLTTKYSAAASHTSDYTGSRPPVDVIVQHDSSDTIAWCGARVVLTADSLNDMWITSTEWRKLGSRVLREKAPFLW